ncbi:hypothetical protein ACFQZ4_43310 [Catellatospora coxensis]
MSTTEVPDLVPAGMTVTGPPRRSLVSRVVGRLGGFLATGAIVLLGVFWLTPVVGLAVASLRSTADNSATGWWTALTDPGRLTLDNYGALLRNEECSTRCGTPCSSPCRPRCWWWCSARWPPTPWPGSSSRAGTGCSS